uniref:Protein kinase domain-containing protein n=1 Tax=Fagus sylvatica TaxID=28930 RepID=A0A2N9FZ04_FAGSY
MVTRMNFTELSEATSNFSKDNAIGLGKIGLMYKAVLPNGSLLAVKRLHDCQSFEKEFISELLALGRLRRNNLVPILGFCRERKEKLLVYKYISIGNLYDWLHAGYSRDKILEWLLRIKIAIGIARGLAWLHNNSSYLNNIIDKSLTGQGFDGEIYQFLRIACTCLNPFPGQRPTMLELYNTISILGERYGVTNDSEILRQYEIATANSSNEIVEHGGGLGLPAIRWWWLIRLIRWWWWLIRPGRERPTPRSRPGRERPTPRPGLAVPDPNGLEVTRADLGLDERDPRHGLGSPSPIPAGLEIVPFENQIAAALGASLGHHRRWVVV